MQEIHFNLNPRYAVFFEDDGSRDHVACHEFGHTIGLRHWGNPPDSVGPPAATCMNANTPNGPTELHQIDIDHINAYRYSAPPPSRRMKPLGPDPMRSDRSRTRVPRRSRPRATRSLRAMARRVGRRSSAGRSAAVRPGRTFGDPSGTPLHYAAITIRISELLGGGLAAHRRRSS